MVDPDENEQRLAAFRRNLEQLDRIPQDSLELWSSDFRNPAATLYLLQTSIQALIDVGGHLIARLALESPERSIDVFRILEGHGHLPQGTASRMEPIVAFRNRVVHLYERVDDERIYEILTGHRGDLAEILELLLRVE